MWWFWILLILVVLYIVLRQVYVHLLSKGDE